MEGTERGQGPPASPKSRWRESSGSSSCHPALGFGGPRLLGRRWLLNPRAAQDDPGRPPAGMPHAEVSPRPPQPSWWVLRLLQSPWARHVGYSQRCRGSAAPPAGGCTPRTREAPFGTSAALPRGTRPPPGPPWVPPPYLPAEAGGALQPGLVLQQSAELRGAERPEAARGAGRRRGPGHGPGHGRARPGHPPPPPGHPPSHREPRAPRDRPRCAPPRPPAGLKGAASEHKELRSFTAPPPARGENRHCTPLCASCTATRTVRPALQPLCASRSPLCASAVLHPAVCILHLRACILHCTTLCASCTALCLPCTALHCVHPGCHCTGLILYLTALHLCIMGTSWHPCTLGLGREERKSNKAPCHCWLSTGPLRPLGSAEVAVRPHLSWGTACRRVLQYLCHILSPLVKKMWWSSWGKVANRELMGDGNCSPGKFYLSEKPQLQGEPCTRTALSWPWHFHGANIWWEIVSNVHCLTSDVTSGQH